MVRRCDSRCLRAKTEPKRCRCVCHGQNHGYYTRRDRDEFDTIYLNHVERFVALAERARCVTCDSPLTAAIIKAYPHSNGVYLPEHAGRFWVHYECPSCGYQNSWLKVWRQLQLQPTQWGQP